MSSLKHKRLFSEKLKEYIYDRANGHCEDCGCDLGDDWEADHIVRFTDGGETTVTNGQALCKQCHLAKTTLENQLDYAFRPLGKENLKPREWQCDALRKIEEIRTQTQRSHFSVNAVPGAGKTVLMQMMVRHYFHQNLIDSVVVIVPSDILRRSVATKFYQMLGLQMVGSAGTLGVRDAQDAVGQVVTYQQIRNEENLDTIIDWWTRDNKRVLVIADEIHHAAEHSDSSWGQAVTKLLTQCEFALLLTGTLWRTDETKIPGIQYFQGGDQMLIANPDYSLGLKEATEKGYVSTVWFENHDIEVTFQPTGKADEKLFGGEDEVTRSISPALGKEADRLLDLIAHKPHSDGVRKLLTQAHINLTRMQTRHAERYDFRNKDKDYAGEKMPAGLVVATDIEMAKIISMELYRITGEKPCIVHSGVDDCCKKRIEHFTKSNTSWIVSVGMVSEGVDINRIKVIAYLTNKKTRLIFSQIVGRAQRVRYDHNSNPIEEDAKVLFPSHEKLVLASQDFIEQQDLTAREDAFREPRDEKNVKDKHLDDLLSELDTATAELRQKAYDNIIGTEHTGKQTIVDGEFVANDGLMQVLLDSGVSPQVARMAHKRASLLGLIKGQMNDEILNNPFEDDEDFGPAVPA